MTRIVDEQLARHRERVRRGALDPLVLCEWLHAIRLEIEARGANADLDTIASYTASALSGAVPHWYTDEYKKKVGHG